MDATNSGLFYGRMNGAKMYMKCKYLNTPYLTRFRGFETTL